jgi:dTDP-4-amino-4,6-dideoxygalactose transaminase
MIALGFNYRLTDFQSALGITQLAKNNKGVERRNEISATYKKAFEGKINFQDLPSETYNAHHLFIIEVEHRKELYDFLHSKGILAQIHYVPVHTMPYYKNIGYEGSDLINAENYYANCISLPMYPILTNEEQSFVIDNILKFIDG